MQNVVDDVNLRLTAAGSTRTDTVVTVVLLRLDSGALERKVYTGCVQAHAANAGSRAVVSSDMLLKNHRSLVVSHCRTFAHRP